jgi:tetratricopeptide (TPR) repeat protein
MDEEPGSGGLEFTEHLLDGWSLGSDTPESEAGAWTGDRTRVTGPSASSLFEPAGPPPSLPLDFALGEGLAPVPSAMTAQPASAASAAREFPRPGEVVNRFRILSELGRGGFARVYLAEQIDLADRRVALKVSEPSAEEPQNLSRLQHTHIVPIHSLHLDSETGWQLLCMPYLGGANLAQVLEGAGGSRRVSLATGRSLVEALDRVGFDAPGPGLVASVRGGAGASRQAAWRRAASRADGARPTVVRSAVGRVLACLPGWDREPDPDAEPSLAEGLAADEPSRRYLRSATYVQAAMWLVARLAEGLQHAHERGILHRDLKPSNILIAADGTPMLLDFNLSVDVPTLDASGGPRAPMGGTLPYMAPEHLEALLPEGRVRPEEVGPAADIYALGLILYEVVVGRLPFDEPPDMPRLIDAVAWMIAERGRDVPSAKAANPQVPWGLESVLRKCLDRDPLRRYATAGELATDLRRLIDDRPLCHAPELSVRERVAKWRRRHPRACGSASVGILAAVLLLAMGTSAAWLRGHLEASEARVHFQAFQTMYRGAQLGLNTASSPDGSLARGIADATAALDRYGVGRDRRWTGRPDVASLPPGDRRRLLEEISELIQLRARAQAREVQRSGTEAQREGVYRSALSWLDLAAAIDPHPGSTLYDDRARYHAALGDAEAAQADRERRDANPARSARDLALLGSSLLAEGRPDAAETVLVRATSLDPAHYWAWFTLGLCGLEEGRPLDASQAFAVASLIEPGSAWAHLNRGLALARAGRTDAAREAEDRAVELDPDWPEARLQRARTALEQGDAATALADLDRAIALGRSESAVRVARAEALARVGRRAEARDELDRLLSQRPADAEVRVARGFFRLPEDPAGAVADFDAALSTRPDLPRALLGRAYARRDADPKAALADLDQALALDPDLADALELRALVRARLADPGAIEDVDRLVQAPTGRRLYNAACAVAILAQVRSDERLLSRAVDLLHRAQDRGFGLAGATDDPDLAGLRGRTEFQKLVAGGP